MPSPAAGRLKEILVREGETVAVGALVAVLETAEEQPTAADGDAPGGGARSSAAPRQKAAEEDRGGHFKSDHAPQLVSFSRSKSAAPAETPSRSDRPPPARSAPVNRSFSPAVLDAARRGGVPLDQLTGIEGTGRGGRITKRDVQSHLSAARAVSPGGGSRAAQSTSTPREYLYTPTEGDRVVPMSNVRRRIAHHMSWSARISPHASAFADCDVSRAAALVASRREVRDRAGAPLTHTVLAARALLAAVRAFPVFNASVVDEAIVFKPHVNLGIAVALKDTGELIVPVVHRADELSLDGLARAIDDLATRARERRLNVDDVQGGTITLTNPGMFGGITGTPILNQPQVAILGLGAITKRAVVVNDAIAIRPVMTMVLTFDHRAVDGMQAFQFLERIRLELADARDEKSE